jgi:penicillin amidase
MSKWLRRGSMALLALVVAFTLLTTWLLRGSLPALNGTLDLPGLTAPVSIARDANGTVTIDAANEHDALRALGYVHAQERYFEMDLLRRTAAGELAALFGNIATDTDRKHRLHRMRARVERDMAAIAGVKRKQLQAYADGVNAGLGALRVRPWTYLLLRQQPGPWRVEDSPLVGHAMYFDLQGGDNARELALWRMRPHLPAALFDLLTHDGSRWDAPLQGAARGDAVLPGPEILDLRQLPAAQATPAIPEPAGAPGSNNFAVSGALTADGRAILADDMHLGLRAPNIWFRARLRYPDPAAPGGRVDVQGVTLPGLPAVIAGSNGHVAWGFTNSYGDYQDWKLETPCSAKSAAAGCARVVRHTERIEVAGGAPIMFEVEETAWGPIAHRETDGRVLSLRWTAHLPGAVNLGLAEFPIAGDLDQALVIAQRTATPTQNLLLADAKGRIAWQLLGPLPQRAETCTLAATVDTSSEACPPWASSTAASPMLQSPAVDRLWTANSRVLDGEDLRRVGDGGYALGARGAQIRDGLQAKTRIGERELLAIQLDDRALLLQPWHALLLERAKVARTPALQALAAASATWEGRASVDSVSFRLVRAWRLAVHEHIAKGLTAPARQALGDDFVMPDFPQLEGVAWPLVSQRPAHLLPPGHASWDALFEDAAVQVRDDLAGKGPLTGRSWGERNTAAICHPLAAAIPLVGKRWLCMPADPLPGDGSMPRVQGPKFGASQRMVVSPGHEADGILHMPGGQSGHPLSPFWGAGHAAWVRGDASPFLPGETRHTLRLQPAAN